MKPTHQQTQFTANREFTDREDARGRFQNAMADTQACDEYRILNWFGIGGQGKSALAREFVRIIRTDPSISSKETVGAKIDFDDAAMRRAEEALVSIRLQLAKAFGHSFPAFDTAFARLFTLTHPGLNIREKHPEFFRGGENEMLNDLLGISPDDLGTAISDVMTEIPGVNLLYKYSMRLSVRVREWYARRGKHVLTGLDLLSADEIVDRLPTYLGADICDLLVDRPKARIAIILDTFEALWRDHNVKDSVEAHRADEWVRRLVQDAPGVLFVILGRDKLCWHQVDSAWGGLVESNLLGNLSEEDAEKFLLKVPIQDPRIRARVISGAEGLPFYLDLQVDQFEDEVAAGRTPEPERFGGPHPRILGRFLDHLSPDIRKVVLLASYPGKLDRTLMNLLAEKFLGGLAHLDWSAIERFSFIEPIGNGKFLMHGLMRQYLQQRDREERPELFAAIHTALFDHFSPQDQDDPSFSLEEEAAFNSAIDHALDAGVDWEVRFQTLISKFHTGVRFRPLATAYGKAVNAAARLNVPSYKAVTWRHKFALQLGNQGRYAEAERELRAIWEFRRQPNVLGELHPSTLTTRHDLAQQIGYQGRYAEAERELRALWEIERQPHILGEEHLNALTTRANLAQQIGAQGRYAEAEREFRAILEILRRPDILGEEHHSTLTTRQELANQIGYQGRYAEAERELRAIWEIERRPDILGEEHPSTLGTRNSLAQMIGSQGRHAEAEVELRAIWEIARRPDMLGEEHHKTLTARQNAALEVGNQGRYAEAERELRAIWEIERRPDILGEEHPSTLTTRHNLALQIGKQGRNAEAEREFRAIWEIARRPDRLGEEHPSTLTARYELAMRMAEQGRHAEAEHELRAIWDVERRPDKLGDDHTATLTTRHNLAVQIGRQGRYTEAEHEFRAIWEIERRPDMLGDDHPNTLCSRFWIARMLGAQGRYGEADPFLAGLLEEMRARLDENHELINKLIHHLAHRDRPFGSGDAANDE